jgi:hypothetical protein
MTLPRFTSGRVGNLEFSHLNEAFDLLEGKQAKIRDSKEMGGESILARLLQMNASKQFCWAEVSRSNDGSYGTVVNGQSSTREANSYFYPAISLNTGAVVGDVVVIAPRRSAQGSLYYAILGSGGTVTRAFQIISNAPHATRSDAWAYVAKTVESEIAVGIGQRWKVTSDIEYTLLNGAENPFDGSSIGVGTVVPSGTTYARRPIKPGTVVLASVVLGDWVFCVPNGYSFNCQ